MKILILFKKFNIIIHIITLKKTYKRIQYIYNVYILYSILIIILFFITFFIKFYYFILILERYIFLIFLIKIFK